MKTQTNIQSMNLIFNGKKTIAYYVLEQGLHLEGTVIVRKRGGWTDNSTFQNLVKTGWLECRMSGPRGGSRYFTTDAGKAALQEVTACVLPQRQ